MILSDLLLLPSLLYGFYLLKKVILWRRGLREYRENESSFPFAGSISILIPVRNEEKNIAHLTKQVLNQSLGLSTYEVIIINDASTDATGPILDEVTKDSKARIIHLDTARGKKEALAHGIKESSGDIIITLDADCEVPEYWLKNLLAPLRNPDVILTQGPVYISPEEGIVKYLQFLESASLQIFTGADFNSGDPGMGNGANLAFRRKEFDQVAGYNSHMEIESGDDVFLIEAFKKNEGKLVFNYNPGSTVTTTPLNSLSEIFNQKLRWAGKWKHYSNGKLKMQGALIFGFNFYFFLMMFLPLLIGGISQWIVFPVFLFKGMFEGILVIAYCSFIEKRIRLPEFFLMVLLYPIYAVFFGIASLFIKSKWK